MEVKAIRKTFLNNSLTAWVLRITRPFSWSSRQHQGAPGDRLNGESPIATVLEAAGTVALASGAQPTTGGNHALLLPPQAPRGLQDG